MWIDPTNPKYILSGSDGGWQVSYDGGKNFEVVNTFPFTQFYHINYDMQRPYMVCGGLQDNGNWCGPSQALVGAGHSQERLVHRVGRRRVLHGAGDGQAVARLLRRAGRDDQHHRHAHRHAEDDLPVPEPRRLRRRRDDQPQVSLQLELADRALADQSEGRVLRRQRAVQVHRLRHVVAGRSRPTSRRTIRRSRRAPAARSSSTTPRPSSTARSSRSRRRRSTRTSSGSAPTTATSR